MKKKGEASRPQPLSKGPPVHGEAQKGGNQKRKKPVKKKSCSAQLNSASEIARSKARQPVL